LFAFRLALRLGYSHPDELLARMTSSQFAEWLAYAAIEPFGEFREELRHGQQMAMMVNLQRDPKQKPEPYVPSDFMNFIDKPKPKQQTPEDVAAGLRAMMGVA
jgi:hypothetical protein